jgi:hypothetical protein
MVIALVVAMITIGTKAIFGSNFKCDDEIALMPYCFGHQISFCSNLYTQETDIDIDRISLFLQVCATNDLGIRTILGYGSLVIPNKLKSGNYNFEIQTCKVGVSPLKSKWNAILFQLNEYYFGCTLGTFESMKDFFMVPKTNINTHHHDEPITTLSGYVHVNVQINANGAKCSTLGREKRTTKVRYLLDEALSKVRREKRLQQQQHTQQCCRSVDGGTENFKLENSNGKEKFTTEATKELLSRVKARKEARQNQTFDNISKSTLSSRNTK